MDKNQVKNGLYLAYLDIKKIWSSHILRVSVLGLMIMPLLYSFLYLWAFWDPNSLIKNLPLAIVNLDQGKNEGTLVINVGQDLANELIKEGSLNWSLTTVDDATNGIEKLKYFLVLIIPEDFTQRAYSAGTSNPQPSILQYKINEGANALGAKFATTIAERVKENVRLKLTERYLTIIFENIESGAVGLEQAAQGAKQLAAGTAEAYKGASDIYEGQLKLGEGIIALQNGLNQLLAGSSKLAKGAAEFSQIIASKVNIAEQYIAPLNSVLSKLEEVLTTLKNYEETFNRVIDLIQANRELIQKSLRLISDISSKTSILKERLYNAIENRLEDQAQDLRQARSALQKIANKNTENTEEINEAISKIDSALSTGEQIIADKQAIISTLDEMNNLSQTINEDFQKNQADIFSKIDQALSLARAVNISDIIARLQQDKEKLASLPEKLNELVNATQQIATGAAELNQGLTTFAAKFAELRTGNDKLTDGTKLLRGGIGKIDEGLNRLTLKLAEAAGIAKQDSKTNERIAVIKDPVKLEQENIHPVPTNGIAFAPYFIALSMWVGSLVLFFVIDLKTVQAIPKRPVSYMVNKYVALASVSVSQAFISIFMLQAGLGLSSVLPFPLLYWFTFIMGLCYVAILFMLLYLLGDDKGRFVAVLILMLQLTSSSGSYPVQLEPMFFRYIQPFLPMTYAIEGLRAIISTGNYYIVTKNMLILTAYAAGSLILLYVRKYRRFLEEMNH